MTALHRFVAVLALFPIAFACSSAKRASGSSANKTAQQFCESWGKAACNETVVSKCTGGGTDVDKCVAKQSQFCLGLLVAPEYYNSENAQACLDAVSTAYNDAKLTADEVKIVRELAAPCDQLIAGPGIAGASCSGDTDCNTVDGLSCVMRPGETMGSCQIPVIVSGGASCSEPYQICADTHYCDSAVLYCLERPNTETAQCSLAKPCGLDFKCVGGAFCQSKQDTGGSCTAPDDCKSGVCSGNVCVLFIELTPTASEICDDLR